MKQKALDIRTRLGKATATLALTAVMTCIASCDAMWGTSVDYSPDPYDGSGLSIGMNLFPGTYYNGPYYSGPYWWDTPGYIPSYGPAFPPVRPGVTVRPPSWGGSTGNVRPPQRPAGNKPAAGDLTKPGIPPSWNTNPGIQLPSKPTPEPSKPSVPSAPGGSGMRPGRH